MSFLMIAISIVSAPIPFYNNGAMSSVFLPPLALTAGEPAGIAAEITVRAWLGRDRLPVPFYIVADADHIKETAARLRLSVPIARITDPHQTTMVFPSALPVLHQPLAVPVTPGVLEPANAPAVLASLQTALAAVQGGTASALVTNPIHKGTLYAAGFSYDGHTEYLEAHTYTPLAVMMLACPSLRVVPLTIHKSLRQAIEHVAPHRIIATVRVMVSGLREYWGIARPRIAVAGLNPHAGEGGTMGDEEIRCIVPALEALREEGIDVQGPFAADGLFHEQARGSYDAALCMYHDQALIPIKTLDFWGAVNITLGLPIIRTSPDHGTALSLAAVGGARPDSLLAALTLAGELALKRVG